MSLIQGFKNAFSQLNAGCSPLSTGNTNLDLVLDGGVHRGCLTEISGEAGVGKSQLCTMIAAKTLSLDKGVVYIDTERGVSLKRCNTLYKCFGGVAPDVSSKLIYYKVCSIDHFRELIEGLSKDSTVTRASLIIVDSIAYFFRGMEYKEQAPKLFDILKNVSFLATKFNIAVILLNHATDKASSNGVVLTVPYLDNVFGSQSAIRIWMHRTYSERYIEVFKNPFGPNSMPTKFIIENDGLHLV